MHMAVDIEHPIHKAGAEGSAEEEISSPDIKKNL